MSAMGLVLAAGLLWGATREAGFEQQLEAAIHSEIVLGDLPGALEQYRQILAQASAPRPVAARALLQTGECLEKLGRAKEAYAYYQKAVTEYKDQAAVVMLANKRLEAWSGPRNLRFEEGAALRVPPGWREANNAAELRRQGCFHDGASCAVVVSPPNVPGQAGNLMQSFNAGPYRGKTVRLRAELKLEHWFDVLGINIPTDQDCGQLWLRVIRRDGVADHIGEPVRNANWTHSEIVGDIDEDARVINFGVKSLAGGRVWIDDVSFEVVPKN